MKENKQALREPEQKNVEGGHNNLCVPHSNPQCDSTHCGVVRVRGAVSIPTIQMEAKAWLAYLSDTAVEGIPMLLLPCGCENNTCLDVGPHIACTTEHI